MMMFQLIMVSSIDTKSDAEDKVAEVCPKVEEKVCHKEPCYMYFVV